MRSGFFLGSCVLMVVGCVGADEASLDEPDGPIAESAKSACSYTPLNDRSSITINTNTAPPISIPKSILITRREGYASVVAPFTLGRALEDVARYVNYRICTDRPGSNPKVIDNFVRNPFQVASNDVTDHNAWAKVKVGTVPTIRDTFKTQILDNWATDKKDGPFRLLAVVNRMDLAGDEDARGGGQLAGGERRWFGEGRLVFGLDRDIDASTPYPMTLIMEYRLPALKETAVAGGIKYEIDPSFDYAAGPAGNAAWIAGRARWAKIWRELSRYSSTDAAYRALLLNVVQLFATGDNHLALRTGEKVFDVANNAFSSEFEYREFYLNGQWTLSTRKLRREPILCAQGSDTLKNRVEAEWNAPASDFQFDFMLGDRALTSSEVTELSSRCGAGLYAKPNGMPYGQDLDSGGFGLRAKFTRFTAGTTWTIDNVTEAQRHKTAAATCSGCHATETGNQTGFHIMPRIADADAQVSAFLSGPVAPSPNGTSYPMNEPGDRKAKLASFTQSYDFSLDYPANHTNQQLYCNANPCSLTTYP